MAAIRGFLDSAIARVEGTAADGDVVDLLTDAGKFVARASSTARAGFASGCTPGENAQAIDGNFGNINCKPP